MPEEVEVVEAEASADAGTRWIGLAEVSGTQATGGKGTNRNVVAFQSLVIGFAYTHLLFAS